MWLELPVQEVIDQKFESVDTYKKIEKFFIDHEIDMERFFEMHRYNIVARNIPHTIGGATRLIDTYKYRLFSAMSPWVDSPEGDTYWISISNDWEDFCKENDDVINEFIGKFKKDIAYIAKKNGELSPRSYDDATKKDTFMS